MERDLVKDYGVKHPINNKKERYVIEVVSTYIIRDKMNNAMVDIVINHSGSKKAYEEACNVKETVENKYGKYINGE